MKRSKRIAKRTASLLLCVVLLSPVLLGLAPSAQANAAVGAIGEMEMRQIVLLAEEYAKIGALEAKLALGGLSAAAAVKGNAILTQLKAGVAATGLTPALIAQYAGAFALGGVVLVTQDWGAYWDAIFNREDFLTTYQEVGNPVGNWIVNFTHFDYIAEWILNEMGISTLFGVEPWSWDYVETYKSGWQEINSWAKGLFGRGKAEQQTIPALGYEQFLGMVGELLYDTKEHTVYMVRINGEIFISERKTGQWVRAYIDSSGKRVIERYGYQPRREQLEYGYFKDNPNYWDDITLIIAVYKGTALDYNRPNILPKSYMVTIQDGVGFSLSGSGVYYWCEPESLGLPATSYINNTDTIQDQLDRIENKLDGILIQFPALEAPTGNDYIDAYNWMDGLRDWTPVSVTDKPVIGDTTLLDKVLAELASQIGTISGTLPGVQSQDYRELLEKMKEYMEFINSRLRTGVYPDSLLSRLWEILLRTRAKGVTQKDVLTAEISAIRTIAKEMGLTETDTDTGSDATYDWQKISGSWSGLAGVFPFCLPFDLIGIVTAFSAEPKMLEPIEVNILPFLPGNTGRIMVDFNVPGVDMLVKIFRTGLLLLFVIGLIMATRGLITW